ncbi:MAG: AmmeMemoRadiSam system radical SAM enzyme [Spirochaetes bacterium]|nr:AmmeMemoRadiSam system radical SAM enzyme [Spirochaetota bacterium]
MKQNKEAQYYNRKPDGKVECLLCPHNCVIQKDQSGICGARANIDGKLISMIYGEVTAVSMDPIEKKPLYHFYPGTDILSIGTKGCNFKCLFCQNWNISQDMNARSEYYKPEEIIKIALARKSIGVAYTYSEPFIWYEYIIDCSKLARENNLKNVFVTNGFINPEPLNDILKYADAMNIDLKTFREETYRKVSRGNLSSVLATIKTASKKCHVELTTLIVTGINDDIKEMSDIIDFIYSVDPDIPWHISRYHPSYKYTAPATDIDFILRVYEEARKKLNYVYCGNIASSYGGSDTICPDCKTALISRSGYNIRLKSLENDKCGKCGKSIKIITGS